MKVVYYHKLFCLFLFNGGNGEVNFICQINNCPLSASITSFFYLLIHSFCSDFRTIFEMSICSIHLHMDFFIIYIYILLVSLNIVDTFCRCI